MDKDDKGGGWVGDSAARPSADNNNMQLDQYSFHVTPVIWQFHRSESASLCVTSSKDKRKITQLKSIQVHDGPAVANP